MEPAPILLFTYKRLYTLKQTVKSLQENYLADQSVLYIFSDAGKHSKDSEMVYQVRTFLRSVQGFKKVIFVEAEKNKGLANSIIDGVSKIIQEYGSVIVLEDDLVVSANFLTYMNQALEFYRQNKAVFSVSGYNIPDIKPANYPYDAYFTLRASSWGWGSWADRWKDVDWEVKDFVNFKSQKNNINDFNKGGSDMFKMLEKAMSGKINSWAIKWCYHQFKTHTYSVFPILSKVQNIGFSSQSTHTNVYNRYYTSFDNELKTNFNFPDKVELNDFLNNQFVQFYSIKSRFFGRIKTILFRVGLIANKQAQ